MHQASGFFLYAEREVGGNACQLAVQPPSMGRAMPVMESAASEQRNFTMAPMFYAGTIFLMAALESMMSEMTLSSGMPWVCACAAICFSTSGVMT